LIARVRPLLASVLFVAPTLACAPMERAQASTAQFASPFPGSRADHTTPELVRDDSDPSVRQQIASVLQRVSLLRELPSLAAVRARVIDRQTMIEQVQATVRTQIPPEAIRGEGAFLRAFGFLPQDYDYEAGVYQLIQSELAGYYDPESGFMYLMDDLKPRDREATLAHELVHALQDQHYRLAPKLGFAPDGNDRQAAVQCLAEGDATSAMLDFQLAPSMRTVDIPEDRLRDRMLDATSSSPDMVGVPYVLRASLVAPYVDGVVFVQRLRWRGGWQAVDAIWRNLPASTEQVLHLDKLDLREPPEAVPVPAVPPGSDVWDLVHTDVYGEQGFRIGLEAWMAPDEAAVAAAGWGGDRAAVFQRRTAPPVIVAAWHIRFDPGPESATNREAEQALAALARAWNALPSAQSACWRIPAGRVLATARHGRDIAIVAGLPQASEHPPTCDQQLTWASRIASQR